MTLDFAARLEQFIRSQTRSGDVKVSDHEAIGGGYVHDTVRVKALIDGVVTTLISRSEPPVERTLMASNLDIEWALLRHLSDLAVPFVAPARWYDADGAVMGTRTIVSEFVDGHTVAELWSTASAVERRVLTDLIVDAAASIATVDTAALPADVDRPPSWDTYVDSRIAHWRHTEAQMAERDPFLRYVAAWLEVNKPPPVPFALVHGDFQATNLVVTDGGIVAIDWEVAHVGDIREDIAWLQMVDSFRAEPIYRGNEEQILAAFRERTGLGEDVINQRTVAYFSMICVLRMGAGVFDQMAAMHRGENKSISVAYSGCVISQVHDDWYRLIEELSSVDQGAADDYPSECLDAARCDM
jgi:aminoglycoside phosphotransferase (APT) family kinase protein